MKIDVKPGYQFDSGPTYTVYDSSNAVLPVTSKNGGVELAMPADNIRVFMTGSVVPFHTCTVTFDHDNGTTDTVQTEKGTTLAIPALPVKANYTFRGWYSQKNGQGTLFERGIPVTGNSTVYACWHAYHMADGVCDYPYEQYDDGGLNNNDGCSITGQVETGYCAVIFDLQNDRYLYDARLNRAGTACSTFPANPARPGFTFSGWYTEPDTAGVQKTVSDTFSVNTVLYAHWAKNP